MNENYQLPVTCIRCGYQRYIDGSFLKKYQRNNPERAALCPDCRGLEQARQRPTLVPREAIWEAVRQLKAQQ